MIEDYEKWLNSGNFDSDLAEDHEEYLEELARKERLELDPLMDSGYTIPNFYGKYR